ncbi:HAD family hydrolase [Thermodesulfobacteriota bacterium]
MIRGIFFDLYGTLFVYGDMEKAWADWLQHFHISLREHGLKLSKEDFSNECDRFFGKDEPTLDEKNLTVFEKRIKSLCSTLEIKICDKDIGNIADLIAGKWQEQIKLDKDAIAVLKELKEHKKLGLVSNFDHPRHVRKHLSKYSLEYLFETVIISGEVGVTKPDPNIFKPALCSTGLTPSEVAYVGDTAEDIEAADAAGMMPILIKRQNAFYPFDFESDSKKSIKVDYGKNKHQFKAISNLRELLFV